MAKFDTKLGKADTSGIQPVPVRAPADTSSERDRMLVQAAGIAAQTAGKAYAQGQAAEVAGTDLSLEQVNEQADVVDQQIEAALTQEQNQAAGPISQRKAQEIKDAQLTEFANNDRVLLALRDRGSISTVEARARRTLNLKRALSNPINSLFRSDFVNAAKDLTGGGAGDDMFKETPEEKQSRLIREKQQEAVAKFEAEVVDRAARTGLPLEVARIELRTQQEDIDKLERLKAIKAERELTSIEQEDRFATGRSASGREVANYVKELVQEGGGVGLEATQMAGGGRMIESLYQQQLSELNSATGITGAYRDSERARLTGWRDGQLAFLKAHDKAELDKAQLTQMDTMAQQVGWANMGEVMALKAIDPRLFDIFLKSGGNIAKIMNATLGDERGTQFIAAAKKIRSLGTWAKGERPEEPDAVADFMNTPEGVEYLSGAAESDVGDRGGDLATVSPETASIYANSTEKSLQSFTSGVAMMASQASPRYRGEVLKAVDIAADKFQFLNKHQGQSGEISLTEAGTIGRNKRKRLNLRIPEGMTEYGGEIKQLYRVIDKQPWIWEHVQDEYLDSTDAFNGFMRGEWQPELNTEPQAEEKPGARGTRIRSTVPDDEPTKLDDPIAAPEGAVAELQELLAAEEAGIPTEQEEARLTELLEQRIAIRDRKRTGGKPVDPRVERPEPVKVQTTGKLSFDDKLKSFENSKNLPAERSGFDGTVWRPHKSIEGGSDTLAYGHKLTPAEVKSGTVNIGGEEVDYKAGITDEQADKLFQQDVKTHKDIAQKKFPNAGGTQLDAITMMVYQGANVTKWKNSSAAITKALKSGDETDWLSAQAHILNSKWATEQTPERALETVHMMYPDTPIETLEIIQRGYMNKRGVTDA